MNVHYVYKIINLKNNKEYIGVRTHSNPEEDKYMGSSKILENLYKIEGKEYFKKVILKTFTSRKEAENYESSLLTDEYCNSSETYNIHNTGNYSEGKHCFRKDLWNDYYLEIRQRYSQGETTVELAKYYNCDNGTIRTIVTDIKRTISESQILRFKRDITSGARNLDLDKHIDEIIDMYLNQNKSSFFISKMFNVNSGSIKRRLIQNGISLRTHAQSQGMRQGSRRSKHEAWEYKEEICSLYNEGKTLTYLSKIYKCDKGTIKTILNGQ